MKELINDDWMNNGLPDKSVQLIIADPPYFEVKGDFDFIWKSFEYYLKDVERWAAECKRVLADNGTLFWWGHAKKIAYSQIIIDRYFNLENVIKWRKTDCQTRIGYNNFNSFPPVTEHLLMYSGEINCTGLERVEEEFIKPNNPFSLYLKEEFLAARVTSKEISKLFPSKTGGLTGCVSNWLNGDNVITEDQYLKIRDYLNGEFLRKEYEDLRKEYEDLRKEYEDQRRYFNNYLKLEDVWDYAQDVHITGEFNHATQKTERISSVIINTCSKKNDLVLIPFAGSGTECVVADRYDRNYIGYEILEKHYLEAKERLKEEQQQMRLNL